MTCFTCDNCYICLNCLIHCPHLARHRPLLWHGPEHFREGNKGGQERTVTDNSKQINHLFDKETRSFLKLSGPSSVPNPSLKSKIKVQRKGTEAGADTMILEATTSTTHNFSNLGCQSSEGKRPSITFLDLPWPSLIFHDLSWPSMTFYDLLWPFITF